MRSRPPMAVLAVSLVIASCSLSDSTVIEMTASTVDPGAAGDAAPTSPQADRSPADGSPDQTDTLVVDVDAAGGDPSGEATPSPTPATTASSGETSDTPSSTTTSSSPSTVAPSTTRPPTTASSTTTSSPATVSSGRETRQEILRLALPTHRGGSFDPDSVAGKNVVLWFWGAH